MYQNSGTFLSRKVPALQRTYPLSLRERVGVRGGFNITIIKTGLMVRYVRGSDVHIRD